ncbi:UNVERIFIED_CONTAM: hypothetical protein GTU68_006467 [Idotea baltica]|nr:hypothetical protein [Idotea baltica]
MARLSITLIAVCLLSVSSRTFALVPQTTQPNVVVILADDLGWADVSYHADRADTPNIDALVAEGIELDRFYVAPMCSPTRAGLMTGRYPIRFGLARSVIPPQRNFGLDVNEQTLAEALGSIGYSRRGVFGKWHLGHHQAKWHPLAQGFTHFEGHYNGAIDYFTHERESEPDWHIGYEPTDKPGYSTDLIAEAASEFIRTSSKDDAPYFCYVPFNSPHSPFQAKPEDLARYLKPGQNVTRKQITERTLKAMIWSLDRAIGRLLKTIEATGEAENTMVWFISDNGGIGKVKTNNLPLRGNKLTTFEGGIRVPACVRWPARWNAGQKMRKTIGYIDVFPTILSCAGGLPNHERSTQRQLDGIDLSAVFSGSDPELPKRDWYSYHGQRGFENENMAISTRRWKLVVEGPDLRRNGLTKQHHAHLFRMPDDLLEKHDLSTEQPQVVEQLIEKLIAHRSLQPPNPVDVFNVGKKGFVPPKRWRVIPDN